MKTTGLIEENKTIKGISSQMVDACLYLVFVLVWLYAIGDNYNPGNATKKKGRFHYQLISVWFWKLSIF